MPVPKTLFFLSIVFSLLFLLSGYIFYLKNQVKSVPDQMAGQIYQSLGAELVFEDRPENYNPKVGETFSMILRVRNPEQLRWNLYGMVLEYSPLDIEYIGSMIYTGSIDYNDRFIHLYPKTSQTNILSYYFNWSQYEWVSQTNTRIGWVVPDYQKVVHITFKRLSPNQSRINFPLENNYVDLDDLTFMQLVKTPEKIFPDQPVSVFKKTDLDLNGLIGVSDLIIALQTWGYCPNVGTCRADLTGDHMVSVSDLIPILNDWGS